MSKEKNYTVRICEDNIVRDPDKVKEILDRVSRIISNSYTNDRRGTKK
jgi:competence transcription factor ComK